MVGSHSGLLKLLNGEIAEKILSQLAPKFGPNPQTAQGQSGIGGTPSHGHLHVLDGQKAADRRKGIHGFDEDIDQNIPEANHLERIDFPFFSGQSSLFMDWNKWHLASF
jgi:hypothetical protein